jgi:uncharacterized protein YceH (UPF0502 family)
MNLALSPIEIRVLACLLEKSLATPEYYPLTLNALTAACNQKSNRDPVMQADDTAVVQALDSLRDRKLAWAVTLAGSRVPKYRHSLPDVIPLAPAPLAVLCELMLRGPQTLAELRTHAGRLVAIPDAPAAEAALQELTARPDGPLAARLPRQPGRREDRFAHLLGGPLPETAPAAAAPAPEPARLVVTAAADRVTALEAQVAALQDEVGRLKAQLADFVKQFA